MHALKATALFAPDTNNIQLEVTARWNKNQCFICAAGENQVVITAKVTGAVNNAVFNFRYLLDCLNNLSESKRHTENDFGLISGHGCARKARQLSIHSHAD
jgi:hypothetical protein